MRYQSTHANDAKNENVTSRRKILTGLGGAAIGLSGCMGDSGGGNEQASPTSTGSGRRGKIRVFTSETSPESKEILNKLASNFQDETGTEVEYIFVSFSQAEERLASLIRSGNPPEVFMSSNNSMGPHVAGDRLAPVDQVIEDINESVGKIPDSTLLKLNGKNRVVPWANKIQTEVIRSDLVEQAGYTLPDPENRINISYEDHLDWIRGIDNLEDKDARGIGLIIGETAKGHHDGLTWLWSNGVTAFDGKTGGIKVTLDDSTNKPRAVEALEYTKKLYNYSPNTTGWTFADSNQAYANGSIAEVLYSIGRTLPLLKKSNPEWTDSTVAIEPPQNRVGSGTTWGAVSSLAIFKNSQNLKGAKEFAKFFMSDKLYMDFLHSVPLHTSPTIPELYNSDAYLDHPVINEHDDTLILQKQLLSRARQMAVTPSGGYNPASGVAFGKGRLGGLLARVNLKGMDPEEAIDQTARELREDVSSVQQ